ncbi:MAG: TonB C-terminal domain-containing protein [Gemmatimonadota bacterium]
MKFRRSERATKSGVIAGLIGSSVVHAGVIGFVLIGVRSARRVEPPMYAVRLIAAPAMAPAAAPKAAPTTPAPEPPAPTKPSKSSKVAPVPPAKTPKRPAADAPAPKPAAPVQPLPGEKPGTGSDIANLDLQGKQFPFPEYLQNIVTQVYRRWARPIGNAALQAEVVFTILRDGSVREIKVIQTSRSYSFDVEAQGAIEQAAEDRAFGPLPNGWTSDLLQVAFRFTPRPK